MGMKLTELPKSMTLDPGKRVQELEAMLESMAEEIEQARRTLGMAEDVRSAIARGRGERKPPRGFEDSAAGESYNNDITEALRSLIPVMGGASGKVSMEDLVEAIMQSSFRLDKKRIDEPDAERYRRVGIKGSITRHELYSPVHAEVVVVREGEFIRLATEEEAAGGKRQR